VHGNRRLIDSSFDRADARGTTEPFRHGSDYRDWMSDRGARDYRCAWPTCRGHGNNRNNGNRRSGDRFFGVAAQVRVDERVGGTGCRSVGWRSHDGITNARHSEPI